MASTTRKPASGKSAAKTPKGKTTQAKAGAGPAIAERSKDAKPTFGKAKPKRATLAASMGNKADGKAPTPVDRKKSGNDSVGARMARGAKAAMNVAAGAVVVAAKGAASLASSVKGSKDRPKAK